MSRKLKEVVRMRKFLTDRDFVIESVCMIVAVAAIISLASLAMP